MEESAWMRAMLRRRYLRLFHRGDSVLDVGCGTGADAVFLAHRGIRVTATDVADGMIDEVRRRIEAERLQGMLEARVADMTDLNMCPNGSFDGMVSAFSGLGTLKDISRFVHEAARVLRSGAPFILHLRNRRPWWDRIRGRFALPDLPRIVNIGGNSVPYFLRTSNELCRAFAPAFQLSRCSGAGFIIPWRFMRWLPRWCQHAIGIVESVVAANRVGAWGGYFVVLEFVRTERAPGATDNLQPRT